MVVALSRVTPAVVQRLQVPVQVLLYAGLFVFAEYLVGWLHLPLPANLVGMVLMLTLILCRVIPLSWVRAGALAAGRDVAVLCSCRGGSGELCATADGGRLADLRGHRPEHVDGAGRHRLGGGQGLSLRDPQAKT